MPRKTELRFVGRVVVLQLGQLGIHCEKACDRVALTHKDQIAIGVAALPSLLRLIKPPANLRLSNLT